MIQKRTERSRKSRNAWQQFYYVTLNKDKTFLCKSQNNKVKESIKEIEVISRHLELIRLSLCQIAEKNRKPTDFACPILSWKYLLWYIPESRESFTSRSAEVITKPECHLTNIQATQKEYSPKTQFRRFPIFICSRNKYLVMGSAQ